MSNTETQEDGHMTMEAEIGVMWPQTQGYLEVPAATSGRNDPLLESPEGAEPAYT